MEATPSEPNDAATPPPPQAEPKNETEKPAETAAPAAEVTATAPQAEVIDSQAETNGALFQANKLDILNDIPITLSIEVGRAQLKIRDLLNLTKDSIIDLNKLAGEPVDIYANGKLIAQGNIITANGKYCVRLTAMPDKS